MPATLDLTGQRYGRLVAVRKVGRKGKQSAWLFNCDCGEQAIVVVASVRAGRSKSCGCLRDEVRRRKELSPNDRRVTHGKKNTAEYRNWINMRRVCRDPNRSGYKYVGGRGIKVCERWSDFANFYEDMGPHQGRAKRLVRIDLTKDFAPGNCKWMAPANEQKRLYTDEELQWLRSRPSTTVIVDMERLSNLQSISIP